MRTPGPAPPPCAHGRCVRGRPGLLGSSKSGRSEVGGGNQEGVGGLVLGQGALFPCSPDSRHSQFPRVSRRESFRGQRGRRGSHRVTLGKTAGTPGARDVAEKGCGGSTRLDVGFPGGEGDAWCALATPGAPRSADGADNAALGVRSSVPRRATELKATFLPFYGLLVAFPNLLLHSSDFLSFVCIELPSVAHPLLSRLSEMPRSSRWRFRCRGRRGFPASYSHVGKHGSNFRSLQSGINHDPSRGTLHFFFFKLST